MRKKASLKNIEKIVEGLSTEEQLKLVEKLAQQLRRTGLTSKKDLDWNELYGLGKGVWKEDAQRLVDLSREDRA